MWRLGDVWGRWKEIFSRHRQRPQQLNLPADVTYAPVSFGRQPRGHAGAFGWAAETEGTSWLFQQPAGLVFIQGVWAFRHHVPFRRVLMLEQREG